MITQNLHKLADAFKHQGYEIRLVGGCVRDFYLGHTPKDIDLCTNATPQQMIDVATAAGFSYIPTGLQHGTLTIVVNGEQFEVTTLRIDVSTDGRHAEVAFTNSFEEDAARRDLTINAMSMDFEGNIYDYFGGCNDLNNGLIRFVGDANSRIKEDYLRILRFFRFLARYGNVHKHRAYIAEFCTPENLQGLLSISVERYWLEMQKLVKEPHANYVINIMEDVGVLAHIRLSPRLTWILPQMSPICALATMVPENQLLSFLEIWKLSGEEQRELHYLVTNYDADNNWKYGLVDGIPKSWVAGIALLRDDLETYNQITKWIVPQFPLRGQDLLDLGFKPGREIGNMLSDLKMQWKCSNFKLSKEELLKLAENS